jgi:hypothetical protein
MGFMKNECKIINGAPSTSNGSAQTIKKKKKRINEKSTQYINKTIKQKNNNRKNINIYIIHVTIK